MIKNKSLRMNILFYYTLIYSVLMFIIWNINISWILTNNILIFKIMNAGIILVSLLNIDKIFKRQKIKLILFFILIYILIIINSWSIDFGLRSREIAIMDLPIFMLYIIIFSSLNRKQIFSILKSLLLLFFIYNILGIIGYTFKFDSFLGLIPNVLVDNYRYSSILTNPNTLGEFAYLSFIVSGFLLVKEENKKRKFMYLFLVGISTLSLGVSMSRSAILMTLVTMFIIVLMYKKLDSFLKGVIKICAILVIVFVIILAIYDYKFLINILRLDQGFTGRVDVWEYVIEIIKMNFFKGIGYGNSSLYFDSYGSFDVNHAHNLYLSLFFELGFIPAFLLILYFVYIILLIIKYYKFTNRNKTELSGIFIFIISFLVGQFFEFSYFKVATLNFVVFALFGILFNIITQTKEEGKYKKKVVHIITGLDNGGAESMLYKLMKHRTNNYRYTVISLHDMGYYGKRLEELGVKVITLNMNNKIKVIYSPFKLYMNIINADIVQTWLYHANFIGGTISWLACIDKIIWGVRQSDVSFENNSRSSAVLARACRYIRFIPNKIISCSDEVTKVHQELGYSKEKFVTIYNGFEIEKYNSNPLLRYKYRELLNIENDKLVFINVARFDIQKDHKTLFESLKILKEKYGIKEFKLVLLGMGIIQDNERLINLVNTNNLNDETLLLGVRDNVNEILNIADIFLLSSLGEGFPNVLGEAMATKLIPLATNVGDCKMIIGDCGYIVNKQDPEEFSRALYNLINLSKKEKNELKEKSRNRIVNNFEINKIVSEYEKVYSHE